MKSLKILLVAMIFLLGFSSLALATPILNTSGDGIEDISGIAYATYQNSGKLLFIEDGNNIGNPATLQAVEDAVRNALSNQSLELEITSNVVITGAGTASGTWYTTPVSSYTTIEFYAVKAENAYAMYQVDPAAYDGSWSTYDLLIAGHPGASLDISHFTAYNPGTTNVPEPFSMLLLGLGLVGLAGVGRKFKK